MTATQIMLDFERRHQRIEHFGASGAWSFDPIAGWSAESKNRLADLHFSHETGIGHSGNTAASFGKSQFGFIQLHSKNRKMGIRLCS